MRKKFLFANFKQVRKWRGQSPPKSIWKAPLANYIALLPPSQIVVSKKLLCSSSFYIYTDLQYDIRESIYWWGIESLCFLFMKKKVFYLYCKIRNSISSLPKHVFPSFIRFYDRFFSVMRAWFFWIFWMEALEGE